MGAVQVRAFAHVFGCATETGYDFPRCAAAAAGLAVASMMAELTANKTVLNNGDYLEREEHDEF